MMMKNSYWLRHAIMSKTGSVLVFSAVGLVMLVSFSALVVDLGFGFVARNELHNISDGAALAGARQLGVIYEALPYSDQQTYVMSGADQTAIINAVNAVGTANRAGDSASITIQNADIRIGHWNMATKTLTVTAAHPDAVQVRSRRDATANGPITTFLAGIMGFTDMNISAQATAALTPIGITEPGELDLPVGISEEWFKNNNCNNNIQFFPTNTPTGCAGWSTFEASPSNASKLRNILQGLDAGTFVTPGVKAGDTFEFIGGKVASALPDLRQLFLDKGAVNPNTGVFEWKTFVAVYRSTDCSNPSGTIEIIGFATVIITNVLAPPAGHLIHGTVKCQFLALGRGGGGEFGTIGSLPGLVQ
jgi:hypothetical protein